MSSANFPPERPVLETKPDGALSKFSQKSKDNPMMLIGLTGCLVIATYGLYSYKRRGKLSLSNYLMQLRVTAQGAVIGCLTLGVVKSIYDLLKKKDEKS